jgi:hypothetical protein
MTTTNKMTDTQCEPGYRWLNEGEIIADGDEFTLPYSKRYKVTATIGLAYHRATWPTQLRRAIKDGVTREAAWYEYIRETNPISAINAAFNAGWDARGRSIQ